MTEMVEQQKKLELQNQELNKRFQHLAANMNVKPEALTTAVRQQVQSVDLDTMARQATGRSADGFSVISEPVAKTGVSALQSATLQNSSQTYHDERGRAKRPITTGLLDEPMPFANTDPLYQPGVMKKLMLRIPHEHLLQRNYLENARGRTLIRIKTHWKPSVLPVELLEELSQFQTTKTAMMYLTLWNATDGTVFANVDNMIRGH